MNPVIQQIVDIFKGMPLSRKIVMGVVLALVVTGFGVMFYMANKTHYQTLYKNLSEKDASAIVDKLKELRVPYQLVGDGGTILVPDKNVYEARLSLAGSGLPKGGGVGFEIFDKTEFGTTEFVQKLNYQRALQGELARTIKDFEEVADARVMIVMARDSVFVEDTKPPSASVMLKLKEELSKPKVDAVVHLVASSIEDLKPELVTVVDTTGRVLFKATTPEEEAGLLASKQYQYKVRFERNLSERIQTMLERIVGKDKAIVRVTSDMDFDQVDTSEEIFDPDGQIVRSRKNIGENSEKQTGPAGMISSVNPVVPPPGVEGLTESVERLQKQDDTVNYEITKTVRRTVKPVAVLTRLSVAAVLDGTYGYETAEDGRRVKKYTPRTKEEMDQFRSIVSNAMGFSEDRGDQVSVESFPFSSVDEVEEEKAFDMAELKKHYGTIAANIVLVLLIFLFVVRPIVKTVKEIKATVEEPALPSPEEERALLEGEEAEELVELEELSALQKAEIMAKEDVGKTANIIKGWLSETKNE